jgi:PAT family beta-lactamase induction signal transducer AmpG
MNSVAVARPESTPFWSALSTDQGIAPALGLGFTSAIPFLLVYSTRGWIVVAQLGVISTLAGGDRLAHRQSRGRRPRWGSLLVVLLRSRSPWPIRVSQGRQFHCCDGI